MDLQDVKMEVLMALCIALAQASDPARFLRSLREQQEFYRRNAENEAILTEDRDQQTLVRGIQM